MSNLRFKDITTTATSPAVDDFIPMDGATNNVRKIDANKFAQTSSLAASATTDTTNASNISSGTLAAARGGAGTTNGILKGNGAGTVSAATAGTDYVVPSGSITGTASNVTGTVAITNGGTGSTTASGARTNLGLVIGTDVLAPNGSAANLTSFPTLNQNTTGTASNVTGTVAILNGGTGATTAANARTNLGLVIGTDVLAPNGSAANLTSFPTLNQNTTGTASNVTGTVAVLNGGTGATTASDARTNLGLVIGTDVLAPNGSAANLTGFPTLNQNTTGTASNVTGTVAVLNGGTGATSAVNARTNLGLVIGTDVLAPTGSGASLTGITATQVGLSNVTNDTQTKAAIVPNTAPAAGQLLVGNAGGTAYAPVSSSGDVTIASTGAMTIGSSKVTNAMLAGSIDLTTKVTGALPIANGGTAATDAATARTNLGLGSIATQAASNVALTGGSASNLKTLQLIEDGTVSATAATGALNYDVKTQTLLYYTSNASGNWTLNIRGDGSTTLDSLMATGDSITLAFLVTQGTTAYYPTALTVDGASVTPKWQGGTAPTAGNASGIDAYAYTVIKTASATFTVLAAQTQFK